MYIANNYVRAKSLEEAWELNQKKNNKIVAGNCWTRLGHGNIGTIISLKDLGLDKIESDKEQIKIGAMVSLREIENNKEILESFGNCVQKAVESIVGVQFRNLATVGGSVWGRFGFSDVLTVFLALGAKVELFKKGIVGIEEFIEMDYDRDVLVSIILPKKGLKASYDSVRLTKTDFPMLNCCVARNGEKMRVVIGAKPTKARFFDCDFNEESDKIVEQFVFGSNLRATEKYRKSVAKVLIERNRRAVM